jgi:hypothetical protein
MLNNIMDAGRKYLASPKKNSPHSRDAPASDNESLDDDEFTTPPAQLDNMSILHSTMQQHSLPVEPSVPFLVCTTVNNFFCPLYLVNKFRIILYFITSRNLLSTGVRSDG